MLGKRKEDPFWWSCFNVNFSFNHTFFVVQSRDEGMPIYINCKFCGETKCAKVGAEEKGRD